MKLRIVKLREKGVSQRRVKFFQNQMPFIEKIKISFSIDQENLAECIINWTRSAKCSRALFGISRLSCCSQSAQTNKRLRCTKKSKTNKKGVVEWYLINLKRPSSKFNLIVDLKGYQLYNELEFRTREALVWNSNNLLTHTFLTPVLTSNIMRSWCLFA